jgi:ADP-L-glycero-D-manno-heptose 6-epimerase
MISAMFKALRLPLNIEYIEMPETIRDQYQYFTEARIERLQRAGYNVGFMPLEAAVNQYVTGFLSRNDRYR